MKETKRNILVGLFMLTGLGVLGALMLLFGERPEWLGGQEYVLEIRVEQLGGAAEGTPVRLNGVEIGRVESLRFEDPTRPDRGVSIVALIRKRYFVPSGARAVIYEAELGIGRGRIDILVPPGGGGEPLPQDGQASIRGEMESMIRDIIPKSLLDSLERTIVLIGNFAGELTPVATDLHDLLKKNPVELVDNPDELKRTTANFSTVVERVDQSLRHVNDVLGDPEVKSGVRESIVNVRRMTDDGRAAFADLRETAGTLKLGTARITTSVEQGVADVRQRMNVIGDKAVPVLENAAQLTANLNRASVDLAEGQGTAGKFLRDDRLYEKLVLFTERITDLVDIIRRIAAKTERQGYLDISAKTGVGPVPVKKDLYDPSKVGEAGMRP